MAALLKNTLFSEEKPIEENPPSSRRKIKFRSSREIPETELKSQRFTIFGNSAKESISSQVEQFKQRLNSKRAKKEEKRKNNTKTGFYIDLSKVEKNSEETLSNKSTNITAKPFSLRNKRALNSVEAAVEQFKQLLLALSTTNKLEIFEEIVRTAFENYIDSEDCFAENIKKLEQKYEKETEKEVKQAILRILKSTNIEIENTNTAILQEMNVQVKSDFLDWMSRVLEQENIAISFSNRLLANIEQLI